MSQSKNDAFNRLERFFTSGRTPHALCFLGTSSANELAEYTAQLFLCEAAAENKTGTPCGACKSCKKSLEKIHPDIIFVKNLMPDGKYKVEALRKVISGANIRPNDGSVKAYIFGEIDAMSAICQNTLLKLTEEPPEYVRIIFTAVSDTAILGTIKSRVVFIDAGAAENAVNDENKDALEAARSFISALANGSEYYAAAALSKIKTREKFALALDFITRAINGAINIKYGGEFTKEQEEFSGSLAKSAELKGLINAEKLMLGFIADLKFNPNITLAASHITNAVFAELCL